MAKILIVDDEEDARTFVKDALGGAGYTVDVAIDGKDCQAKVLKTKYDLVLMDVFMPSMSGREVFEQMLRDPYTKNIPVAFFTVAKLSRDKIALLSTMGAKDYIQKPISAKDLVARVKKIVG